MAFEAMNNGSNPFLRAKSIIGNMEREEIERIADDMIKRYDEVYFDYMNRILDEVRAEANNSHETTQRNLGLTALEALGVPKIP